MKPLSAIIVAAVAALALLSACSSEDDKPDSIADLATEAPSVSDQPQATEAPTAQPTAEVTDPPEQDLLNLTLGETAQIGDAQVTANSWRTDPGSEFLKPDAGKKWIVVDVTVVNTGEDEYNLSSLLQMSIRDSEGREHSDIAFAETSGSLDGTIAIGDSLRGETAIEVPDTATGLQFVFGQSFGSEQARWNLP